MAQDNIEQKTEKKTTMTVIKRVLFVIECIIIVLCLSMSVLVLVNPGSVDENGKPKATMLTVQTDSMEPTINTHALIFTKKADEGILPLNTIVTYVTTRNGQKVLNTHRIVGYRYNKIVTKPNGEIDRTDIFENFYWSELGGVNNEEEFYAKFPRSEYVIINYVTRGDRYTKLYSSFSDYSVDNSGLPLEAKEGWDDINPYLSLNGVVAVFDGRKIDGIGAFIDYVKKPVGVVVVIMIPLILLLVYQIISLIRIIVKSNVAKVREQVSMSEEEIKKKAIEEYLKSQSISKPSETNEQQGEEQVENKPQEEQIENELPKEQVENKPQEEQIENELPKEQVENKPQEEQIENELPKEN